MTLSVGLGCPWWEKAPVQFAPPWTRDRAAHAIHFISAVHTLLGPKLRRALEPDNLVGKRDNHTEAMSPLNVVAQHKCPD